MKEQVSQFNTFDEFFAWLGSPETDVKDGQSEEHAMKQAIRRSSIEIVRKNVQGDTLEARDAAMGKLDYKARMKMVYEELTK